MGYRLRLLQRQQLPEINGRLLTYARLTLVVDTLLPARASRRQRYCRLGVEVNVQHFAR